MPYLLVEVELTEPLTAVRLGERDTGVGVVSRRNGHVVGFAIHSVDPGSVVPPDVVAALLDPHPTPSSSEPPDDGHTPDPGPAITVAVCTRDRPRLVQRCVASILAAGARPDDVLIVDNAPSDERTADVATTLGVGYEAEPCPGLDVARNRALHAARHDIVAFVDDDVVVDRHWLASLRATWREHPDAGAVTGQILPMELATHAQIAFERRGGFRGGNRPVRYAGLDRDDDPVYPYRPGMFGAGANVALRRSVALGLGGFDEALDTGPPLPGGGDIDMMHRVIRHGYPLVYEPRAVVFHQHRRTDAELARQYRSWGRSLMAFAVKTYWQDPEGRAKLRRLVRWFFVTQSAAAIAATRRWDRDARRAAVSELRGGVVGVLGAYGRSKRRMNRLRRVTGEGRAPDRP